MFFKSLVLFSSFFVVVSAQSDNSLELQAIKAHFSNAGIVPDLLATFNPTALLNVSFADVGVIEPGQRLQQARMYNPSSENPADLLSLTLSPKRLSQLQALLWSLRAPPLRCPRPIH